MRFLVARDEAAEPQARENSRWEEGTVRKNGCVFEHQNAESAPVL
jgi:hypothetical protein